MRPLLPLFLLAALPAAAQDAPDPTAPTHALQTSQESRLVPTAQACRRAAQAFVAALPPGAQASLPAGQTFDLSWTPLMPGLVTVACRAEGRQWRFQASVQGF